MNQLLMGNSTVLGVNADTSAAATEKLTGNVQQRLLQTPSALIRKYAGSQQKYKKTWRA